MCVLGRLPSSKRQVVSVCKYLFVSTDYTASPNTSTVVRQSLCCRRECSLCRCHRAEKQSPACPLKPLKSEGSSSKSEMCCVDPDKNSSELSVQSFKPILDQVNICEYDMAIISTHITTRRERNCSLLCWYNRSLTTAITL